MAADDGDGTVTKENPSEVSSDGSGKDGNDLGDVIGIDLGTTYSCVAVAKVSSPFILPSSLACPVSCGVLLF